MPTIPARLSMSGQTILYTVWFLVPGIFFLIALWGRLEQISNRQKVENPGDFFNQGIFLTGCVVFCVLFDLLILDSLVGSIPQDILPKWFFQVLLLPCVIYIAAIWIGPSKQIRISKAPTLSTRKRRK